MTEIEIFSAIEEIAPTLSQKQVKAIYILISSNIKMDKKYNVQDVVDPIKVNVNNLDDQAMDIPHSNSFQSK